MEKEGLGKVCGHAYMSNIMKANVTRRQMLKRVKKKINSKNINDVLLNRQKPPDPDIEPSI